MAKTFIIDSNDETRAPFLRGILTRSLTDAGLAFETAYELSSEIRQQIAGKDELSTDDLRKLVLKQLEQLEQHEVIENYESLTPNTPEIMVTDRKGVARPFSTIEHRQSLESSGLDSDKASLISQSIYLDLLESYQEGITSDQLGRLTHEKLKQRYGKRAANSYLVWADYKHSKRPLILLIGGATGCGKSTVATEVAHRLNIIRTQSTDMLREVMRMMIPQRLMPELHTSSFNAWQKTLGQHEHEGSSEELMIHGYLHQCELVSVPCEAVVQRALKERVSLILEGVHVTPTLYNLFKDNSDAVIVPIVLAVLKQNQLKHRLKDRGITAPERSEDSNYLSNFESIWMLQSHLLSEADNHSVSIIANDNKDQATDHIMRLIIEVLEKNFHAKVEDVFGTE
ncbi:MAG: zeta toxin family protein [Candidatus Thiodiazotropha taylori]|nr:zeta toxin family protein [Candidatus Thiodiazotropha taylori]